MKTSSRIPVRPAVLAAFFSALFPMTAVLAAEDSPPPRFVSTPTVSLRVDGAVEWSAAVDCASSAALNALVGARVAFSFDYDLDGSPDGTDSLGISPGDCEDGRVALRRALFPSHPAVLRAEPQSPLGQPGAAHSALTGGPGSLLAIARYCARPQNGEPEWVEIRSRAPLPLALEKVRLEARALTGTLSSGEAVLSGSDTAELRLWQPAARLVALSSWPNLRNTGDTIRLAFEGLGGMPGTAGLLLDSVIYGSGAYPREECASLETEGSAASASGYELELPSPRWNVRAGAFVVNVRAPAAGRYDLRAYDLDGRELCALARDGAGPASFSLPGAACAGLDREARRRPGKVILHLAPRRAPGVRTVLRITE